MSNGIVIGIVADLNDPDRLGRVRVQFPQSDNKLSDWARVIAPMGGANRGLFWRPEKGDEILVLFELGDPTRPYVVGGLWSTSRKPPADDGQAAENNWRFLRSRSGHVIKLDDTKGKERIEIIDKDNSRKIVVDSGQGKVQILCEKGDIEIKAGAGAISIEGQSIQVKAKGSMSFEAGGELNIKGATVNIN